MGAKPSKSSDDRILRSFNNNDNKTKFRDVLRRKTKKTLQQQQQQSLSTPSNCTTEHELPIKTIENDISPPPTTSTKRASPSTPYDASKSKKSRRATASYISNAKHLSVISTTTSSDIGIYSNKSNISSGCWTALSNDLFSQIEANTSAFTEITDHSTISKYPLAEYSPITAKDILDSLHTYPHRSHAIIKDAFQRAQQQNDAFDWSQFFLALDQYPSKNNNVIIYLAKCHLLGLGTPQDVNRGLQLLESNPSCESYYALGRYYLDHNKETAYHYFLKSSQYDIVNDSILMTVGEAQCTLARMLFQGEGVTQNSKEALHFLQKSAENTNM